MTIRSDLLREAIEAIDGDRNVQYGEPTADFTRTANVLNALEFQVSGKPLQPHHIAVIGNVLKLSRLTWSPSKKDHWLDIAGYAGCGWECAKQPDSMTQPVTVFFDDDDEPRKVTYQHAFVDGKWLSHKFIDGKFVGTEDYIPMGVRLS